MIDGIIDFTHVSQMTRVRAIITPQLTTNVSFASFAYRQSFPFLSTLHDHGAVLVVHILVYAPEGRAFLE